MFSCPFFPTKQNRKKEKEEEEESRRAIGVDHCTGLNSHSLLLACSFFLFVWGSFWGEEKKEIK